MNKLEQLKELAKIMVDTPYALKTYLQTYDNTQKRYVPFELFEDQIRLVKDLEEFNENITKKYRQAGVSTVVSAWISKKLQTADISKPEKVLIIANKRDTAIEMANKIRGFIDQWPEWINKEYSPDKNSESRFKLKNNCEVKAVATSNDALRGYTPTILIFDEAAYIEAGDDFWAASMASLSTGGKIIVISCVTKDTFVFTNNGLEQVCDFINEEKSIGEGYVVPDYNIMGKDKLRSSNLMLNNGLQKTLKIKTDNSILEGTLTHKIWGYSKKNKKYDWFKLSELTTDDYVCVNYGFEKWGNNDEINFNYTPTNKEDVIFQFGNKITKEMAYLFGLYIVENSLHNTNNLQSEVYSKEFLSFLEYLDFDLSVNSSEKKIPKRLLKMNRENIIYLLKGIFDSNGFTDKKRGVVGITLPSKILINQIRMLLLNIGILTNYKEYERKVTNKVKITKTNYKISCDRINSKLFYEKIGFNFKTKQDNYKLVINKNLNYNDPRNIIPNGANIIKKILSDNNIKPKDFDEETKKIYKNNLRNDNISRETFRILYEFLKTKTTNLDLEKIFFENSKWVKIKKIEDSENLTYDFSLYNDKNDFWAHSIIYNGILGHQTPNGYDSIYYPIYNQAILKVNNFHITDLKWYRDPRYTKDLKFIKVNDIVHYMLTREEYNDDEITIYDPIKEKYEDYIRDGYKPYSTWFETMSKKLKYDKRKISQEIDGDFLGSGDRVISSETTEKLYKECLPPKEKLMMGQLWQWKDPIPGHRYILGCLPPGEKVMTDDGLINIEKVNLTNQLINEKGEQVKIKNKQVYSVVDEDVYELKVSNTYRTTKFTKEHPILVGDLNENNFKFKNVSDVTINDWIKVPNVYKKEKNIDLSKKWVEINVSSPLKNKDFWWLMGVWLYDGWLYSNKISKTIHFSLNKTHKKETEKCINIISEIFDQTPILIGKETIDTISFKSLDLFNFIVLNFGGLNYQKIISEWIKYLPEKLKKSFICGFFKVNDIKRITSIESIDLEVLEGVQDILLSLGIVSNLKKEDTEINYVLSVNEVDSCIIDENKDYAYFKIVDIKKTSYTGLVYNFQTETSTFMCNHITTHNCDVSRGDSEDYSSINIIDFDEREQVLEYIGKIPPDTLATIVYKWGILYDAFVVIDITGGMGVATSRKLLELNYKSLFYDNINSTNVWEYDPKLSEKIPGINFNNKRSQIISTFEEQLRTGFIVRSERLMNEINTFVFINGRPDHMKGTHDDSIMSLSIALYAGEISFTQLNRVNSINKAMLESYTSNEKTYDPNLSIHMDNPSYLSETPFRDNNLHISKEDYKKYSWLFGNIP